MKKLLLAVLIAVSCVAFAPSYAKAEGGPTMGLGINFDVGYGANKVLEILDKNGMGYGANVFFNYFFTENFALAANFDYIQYTPTADKDFVLGCAALLVGLKVVLPLDALKLYGEADVGYSNWRIEYDNVEYGTSSNRLAFSSSKRASTTFLATTGRLTPTSCISFRTRPAQKPAKTSSAI